MSIFRPPFDPQQQMVDMGGGHYRPGEAWRSLGYNYQLPERGYSADARWNGWDLAMAQYGAYGRGGHGGRALERDWFDTIVNRVSSYFANRRMTDQQTMAAHRQVYYAREPELHGFAHLTSQILGGAAAFQAFLIWDRDHHDVYESLPVEENRKRLVSMAVGEVYALWERLGLLPLHAKMERTFSLQDAAETAAATAKYMFDHQYTHEHERYDSLIGRRRHRRSGSHSSLGETGGGDRSHHSHASRSHHRRHESEHAHPHHHGSHHRQQSDAAYAASLEHSREREAAYRPQNAGAGMMPGMVAHGMGHRPPGYGGVPLGLGSAGAMTMMPGGGFQQGMMGGGGAGMYGGMGMGMQPGMMGMANANPMMGQQSMMGYPGMSASMPMPMMGGGIATPGHSSAMDYGGGNAGGPMMENQMMAQHQAMHGQAIPGMSPEYAHRMDGEGPIPGTRQYTEAFGYGAGQGMYGNGPGYGGGQGMYGQGYGGYGNPGGRGWYGRG